MNWIDGILLGLLLVSVIVGSKKGMIRELMAFLIFFVAIVVTVNYIDEFAIWVYDKLGGSPLVSAVLSFILLLAGSYVAFKLLGILFYKVANLKSVGRKDQLGGALVGFFRGWVSIGFLSFLVFLLPMPDSFYVEFESSMLGSIVAKTVPLMYDATAPIHPSSPDFLDKIESTLLVAQSQGGSTDEDRIEVYKVLRNMRRFFDSGLGES